MLIEFQAEICAACMDKFAIDGTYTIRFESLGDGMNHLDSVEIDGRDITHDLDMAQNFAVLHHIYQHEQAMKDRAATLDPRLP